MRRRGKKKGEVENANVGFDVVIGNPPYVRARIDKNIRLPGRQLFCWQ
ncbi:MAG: Eco57I restriction-modification methylase domain-containing protein [Ignavibacteriales bacterium]|nr:Eco57I restriction-modification methylase domain-containing protein [Ignavibacteriales bacterium]